jgi:hypothetical protein
MKTQFKPVRLFQVKIKFQTAQGVQMEGKKFPASQESNRHIELLVPATNERVSFSRKEVI